ncbi:MAG: cation transporter [Clostridia bacterium]|nr:cation transporter [Clostridia bacterium]
MTKLLLRLFAKSNDRTEVGKLSGVVGIIANLVIAILKLVIGTLSSSVSITADAMNNLSDSASSVITLVGFKIASQPADKDHPYGHARAEYLSGLGVAAIIIIIGFELAKTSVLKIFNPTPTRFSLYLVAVLLFSIAIKLWLASFNKTLGKKINSSALIATSADSRNDVIATTAVLICAILEHFTSLKLDGFMGLGVALFILYSGISLAKETISPLLGQGADPEMKALIVDYVSSCPKVLGFHDLMVHDYGAGCRFASLHVEMDKDEDPLTCHELIDDMERECLESHGINLVIHYDPVVTNDPKIEHMKHLVLSFLRMRDERLSIHDFRMVLGEGHTNLIFDVSLPLDLRGEEKKIKSALDNALNEFDETKYYTVITFDTAEFN